MARDPSPGPARAQTQTHPKVEMVALAYPLKPRPAIRVSTAHVSAKYYLRKRGKLCLLLYWVPEDGGWTNWSSWSECSITCGNNGIQERSRSCTNPPQLFGGAPCGGALTDEQPCASSPACPGNREKKTTLKVCISPKAIIYAGHLWF